MSLKSSAKHTLHCLALFFAILVGYFTSLKADPEYSLGLLVTGILCLQHFAFLLSLPLAVVMFLGLVLYNAFPDEVKIQNNNKRVPFVCIRTVTRGLYPELVLENVSRNMKTCFESGLENFVVEVVTDKSVGLPSYPRLREVVVPPGYKTRCGTLYKARALQYSMEQSYDLTDDDWIVHLDEETVMTPGSVRGIINFIQEDKHQLGQGMITYANEGVSNWITTLADTTRIADDLGLLRFQLRALNRLLMVWKGSFLVIKAAVERKVTFDHGPEGSITEDINFGMMAAAQNYSFGFIEGEMWETSPLTLADYIRQRCRWSQGVLLVSLNKKIPLRVKWFLCYTNWLSMALPFLTPCLVAATFLPSAFGIGFSILRAFTVGIFTYTFAFGIFRTFSVKRLGLVKYTAFLLFSFLVLPPVKLILDTIAIVCCIFTKKLNFHIVEKKSALSRIEQFII